MPKSGHSIVLFQWRKYNPTTQAKPMTRLEEIYFNKAYTNTDMYCVCTPKQFGK